MNPSKAKVTEQLGDCPLTGLCLAMLHTNQFFPWTEARDGRAMLPCPRDPRQVPGSGDYPRPSTAPGVCTWWALCIQAPAQAPQDLVT